MDSSSSVPQVSSPNKLAWTVTRCSRLLRPFKTKLEALKKHVNAERVKKAQKERKEHEEAVGARAATSQQTNTPKSNPLIMPRNVPTPETISAAAKKDPDWVPSAVQRINKRKYTARGSDEDEPSKRPRLDATKPAIPGKLEVPTPFFTRAQTPADVEISDVPESPIFKSHIPDATTSKPTDGRSKKEKEVDRKVHRIKRTAWPTSHKMMAEIQREATAEELKLFEAVKEATHLIITKTNPTVQLTQPKAGTRSLFATCIRQMPRCIAAEDEWQKEDDPEYKEDTTIKIFEELQTKYGTDASGWKPLRELVRTQAVTLLQEAISKSYFTLDMVKSIVTTFTELKAYTEAQDIVSAYLEAQPRIRPTGAKSEVFKVQHSPPLHVFRHLEFSVPKEMYRGYLVRTLEYMFDTGRLSIDWVGTTQFARVWTQFIIRSICHPNYDSDDAMKFLITAVQFACGFKEPTVWPTKPSEKEMVGLSRRARAREFRHTRIDIRDALCNTMATLFTLLTSIVLTTSEEQAEGSKPVLAETILVFLGIDVMLAYGHVRNNFHKQAGENLVYSRYNSPEAARHAHIITCLLLIMAYRDPNKPIHPSLPINKCVGLLQRIASSQPSWVKSFTVLDALPMEICTIAPYLAKVEGKTNTLDIVKALCNNLLLPNYDKTKVLTRTVLFCRRLALDTATCFHNSTRKKDEKKERALFIDDIERYLRQHPLRGVANVKPFAGHFGTARVEKGLTPKPGKGWRWEPAIEEWIAATPAKSLSAYKEKVDENREQLQKDVWRSLHEPPPVRKLEVELPDTTKTLAAGKKHNATEGFEILAVKKTGVDELSQERLKISFKMPKVASKGNTSPEVVVNVPEAPQAKNYLKRKKDSVLNVNDSPDGKHLRTEAARTTLVDMTNIQPSILKALYSPNDSAHHFTESHRKPTKLDHLFKQLRGDGIDSQRENTQKVYDGKNDELADNLDDDLAFTPAKKPVKKTHLVKPGAKVMQMKLKNGVAKITVDDDDELSMME